MRRSFSMLFSLILLALVVYNMGQVISLKREVKLLKAEVATAKAAKSGKSIEKTSLAGKAQKHVDLARQYALKGDFKRADAELNKGLELLEQAGRDTTEPYTRTFEKTQRALKETRAIVDRLLQKDGKSQEKGGKG